MAVALQGAGRPYNEKTSNGSPVPAAGSVWPGRLPSTRPWNFDRRPARSVAA